MDVDGVLDWRSLEGGSYVSARRCFKAVERREGEKKEDDEVSNQISDSLDSRRTESPGSKIKD